MRCHHNHRPLELINHPSLVIITPAHYPARFTSQRAVDNGHIIHVFRRERSDHFHHDLLSKVASAGEKIGVVGRIQFAACIAINMNARPAWNDWTYTTE